MSGILRVPLTCVHYRWIWVGCILLIPAVALAIVERPTESGDLWIGFECGRYTTAGGWATQDPNRTWQMRLLDRFGLHLTFRDPFGAKTRAYDPNSLVNCGWINQNWLSHVIAYRMRTAFGEDEAAVARGETLIVLWKFVQVTLIGLLMYGTARILGAHPALSTGVVVCAFLIGQDFFDLRANNSSFLFASVMMLILALRRRSQSGTVVYWMILVMALWANTHGGFVFALMAFSTACICDGLNACLQSRWPKHFVPASRGKLLHLLLCTGLLFAVSAVVTPFGIRNLFHPLLIGMGTEAKIFRQIAEWRPIWENRFAGMQPYLLLLFSFGAALLTWLVVWIWLRPGAVGGNQETARVPIRLEWPRLDLAQIGIVSLTALMAIKARRFIPLAGIVAFPVLAHLLRQIGYMIGWGRLNLARERLSEYRRCALALFAACLPVTASLLILGCNYARMKSLSRVLHDEDDQRRTVFERMVIPEKHPTGAAWFLSANRIKGVVFNHWIDGGFIAFQQTPDPNTGEPPCKVFIDGRSQAAYDISHYLYWRLLNSAPNPNYREEYGQVEAEAQRRGMNATDEAFLECLIAEYLEGPSNGTDEKERKEKQQHAAHLLNLALSNPVVFDMILKREEITAALMSLKLRDDFRLYDGLPDWSSVYLDDRHVLFLRNDYPENGELLAKDPIELAYPDDFSRKLSVGLRYCRGDDPARHRQGVRLLMSIDRPLLRQYVTTRDYIPGLTDHIIEHGLKIGMHDELIAYLNDQIVHYERPSEDAADSSRDRALIDIYNKLTDLATMRWEYETARCYYQAVQMHRERRRMRSQQHGRK